MTINEMFCIWVSWLSKWLSLRLFPFQTAVVNWVNRSNWKDLTSVFVAWPQCHVYETPTLCSYNRRLYYHYCYLCNGVQERREGTKSRKCSSLEGKDESIFCKEQMCSKSSQKEWELYFFNNKTIRYKEKDAICWPSLWRLQWTMTGWSANGPEIVSWPTNINFKHAIFQCQLP